MNRKQYLVTESVSGESEVVTATSHSNAIIIFLLEQGVIWTNNKTVNYDFEVSIADERKN